MSRVMRERIELLEQEVAELQERVRHLEEMKFGLDWHPPVELALTPAEAVILAALIANERCSKENLLDASRQSGLGYRRDEVEPKIVDVYICKLRRKLQPHGLEIVTLWGRGYQLAPESRQRLQAWEAA